VAQSDPRMITLAREALGWTQKDLASAAGITQGHLSKLESGLVGPGPGTLEQLASALHCPIALLEYAAPVRGVEVTCFHHRRKASTMGASTKKRIEALAQLTRISVDGLLNGVNLANVRDLHRADGSTEVDPESAAADTRIALGVPSGPVENLMRAIESAGVVVVQRALGTASQDAVTTWPADSAPMMIVNTGLAADRLRFTVAHELGHLVLHAIPGDEQEAQADRFASAFLAPAIDIRPDLVALKTTEMGRLMKLKVKWGLSIAALIRRARDLQEIDESQYREFQMKLSRLGWRTVEPGAAMAEAPNLLSKVIDLRRAQQGLSSSELAGLAVMSEESFSRYYLPVPKARNDELRLVMDDA